MSVTNSGHGIVNGHWEPSEPRRSIRLAVACLGGAKLLKKAAVNAVSHFAPVRRVSEALMTSRGAW
jgi:hypothetical protein